MGMLVIGLTLVLLIELLARVATIGIGPGPPVVIICMSPPSSVRAREFTKIALL